MNRTTTDPLTQTMRALADEILSEAAEADAAISEAVDGLDEQRAAETTG